MNDEQKLKAIIHRAEHNGYVFPWDWEQFPFDWLFDRNRYFQVIFSKDFAKSFFGEEYACDECCEEAHTGTNEEGEEFWQCDTNESHNGWGDPILRLYQAYLQELVLQDNYIDYLYSFIPQEGESITN
jgi:hypothetical protein